jgi:cell division protein FtsL
MIGERYAPATRVRAAAKSSNRGTLQERLIARPAVSGRARLSLSVGNSVLIQLALAMSLVAFAAMVYLFQASQVSIMEMNIGDLQNQQVHLRMDNAALQTTAASLQSLQRIDAIATNQLHMIRPDISTSMWITSAAPRISAIRAVNADVVEAQRQSQPLAWMQTLATFVKSSL